MGDAADLVRALRKQSVERRERLLPSPAQLDAGSRAARQQGAVSTDGRADLGREGCPQLGTTIEGCERRRAETPHPTVRG